MRQKDKDRFLKHGGMCPRCGHIFRKSQAKIHFKEHKPGEKTLQDVYLKMVRL